MTFELLSPETFQRRMAARYGADPSGPEGMAEVIRCELSALGQVARWVLARRVMDLLRPCGPIDAEALADAMGAVVRLGDASVGPGGQVARAPLRAVDAGAGGWLLVGTVPTEALRARVGTPIAGLPRRVGAEAGAAVREAVGALGGRVIDVGRWAGLDRTPALEGWREELQARLEAAGRFADRAGALQWEELEVYAPGRGREPAAARWKAGAPGEEAALVRARQAGGWLAHGWARAGSGGMALVPLTGDEARRTALVVDAAAGAPARLPAARVEGGVEVALSEMLPGAEYRYLVGVGEVLARPRRVRLGERALGEAAAVLRERLGIVVEERAG